MLHDFWTAYESIDVADRQYCLMHLLRELEKVDELCAATPRAGDAALACSPRTDPGVMRVFGHGGGWSATASACANDRISLHRGTAAASRAWAGGWMRELRMCSAALPPAHAPHVPTENDAAGDRLDRAAAGQRFDRAAANDRRDRVAVCVQRDRDATDNRVDRVAVGEPVDPDAVRMCNRLRRTGDHLFTFLDYPQVPFENNFAERQIRPAVILRKNSQSNRSDRGATTQAVLTRV